MRHGRRQQMAERDAAKQDRKKTRSLALISGLAAFSFAGLLAFAGYQLLLHPQTPLRAAWNPVQPLRVADQVTPVTSLKLSRTVADPALCQAALMGAAAAVALPPLRDSDQCFIESRFDLVRVGQSALQPVETSCETALRLAMWEEHSVQPAAEEILGQPVREIRHIGSYNCRQMRTSSGLSQRMSTHATASAIDVAGFQLDDGRVIRLISDWERDDATAAFLRGVRDGACDWFGLTLSPDFNRLHADHFHLQTSGWGGCR